MSEGNEGNKGTQKLTLKERLVKGVLQQTLYEIAVFMETVIGIFIVLALVISIIGLFRHLGVLEIGHFDSGIFHELLKTAFNVVIGVEFLKMLCRHNLSSVIEVLLFAIARGMVVEHATPVENLISIIAIAVLFLIRKYLFIEGLDNNREHDSHI